MGCDGVGGLGAALATAGAERFWAGLPGGGVGRAGGHVGGGHVGRLVVAVCL